MRYHAYFLHYLSRGVSFQMARQFATIAIAQERPRPLNRMMDSEEWDDWPYDGQQQEHSERQSVWQILTSQPSETNTRTP